MIKEQGIQAAISESVLYNGNMLSKRLKKSRRRVYQQRLVKPRLRNHDKEDSKVLNTLSM